MLELSIIQFSNHVTCDEIFFLQSSSNFMTSFPHNSHFLECAIFHFHFSLTNLNFPLLPTILTHYLTLY